MKVFVSWSGQRSKVVAELISDWIKCVLQASQPWISTRDIDKGAIWFSEISDQLKDTAAGIVCLTQENKNKPWILFETGALAKGLSTNRVCTFLIDLQSSEIEDPLAQFNHTFPERTSMWGLTCSLNACLDQNRLDERILRQVFDTYWPQFDQKFKEAIKNTPQAENVEPRSEQSILAEILSNTRSLSSRVRELESRQSVVADKWPSFTSSFKTAEEFIVELANNDTVTIQEVLRKAEDLGVERSVVEDILSKYRMIMFSKQRSRKPSGKEE
ncbi:TIR domain-containing protein [Pseudomonas sp. 43mfcvi1.1]|uniref:TIR domain-containing protein n=1 Tax=Pseudomonas sp. 43mfcvi1.1 TaxID=1761894 RepID=UPI000D6D9B7E|nr:TIR domain-containing protein [Pseudomonas sp. 43mfcvi1.1]PWJ33784.1 TIR domain-containing protein [Pseudomonas sp. 43mfcvi1.1]SSB97758.1 TIR domain-containing protein [Pseudomonas sp. 43mfcvi1.1]